MQFGFMPGRGTTCNFHTKTATRKVFAKKKNTYFASVDLEKAFNQVPHRILWWAMRKLEWIIQIVKFMYDNAHSKVRITDSYSNPINVFK